jgi:hypothetical protein
VVGAVAAFEVYLAELETPVNRGAAAELLAEGHWKVTKVEGSWEQAVKEVLPWSEPGAVWTFYPSGDAETGYLLKETNRYDRRAESGWRKWKWTSHNNELTMKRDGEKGMAFAVAALGKEGLKLTAMEEKGPILEAARAVALEDFPDLRVVFYGGILAPMLVTMLLAWLISREVVYHGFLRFLLGWPLTVLLGLAVGAGAGYLLDMLDDFSRGDEPYWMMLGAAQGGLGVLTGFFLAVLSSLKAG